jgi:hypothetical protein
MKASILIVAVLAAAFARESAAQTIFARQHDMLVQTIRSGHAEGVMTGETADLFRKQFKSDGLLLVSAAVIQDFEGQPDCKRMKAVYTKKEVITPNGPRDLNMEIKLNYCLSGHAPRGLEGTK